jgi:cytochrome c biogenesis protein CcmG, thiol:disulfide interchange protein DsbE
MRRLIAPALSVLVGLAWVCAVGVPAARADEARFVPWKDVKTPPLALRDLAGRQHALADYRGKVVLVNFWATWCEPCREEMPSMQRLTQHFAGRPFAILAVNYGESDIRAGDFLKRSFLDLTVLLDPGQDASRAWRVRVLPASFLLGADGRVRYGVIGEIDWMSPPAIETVRGLFP